MVEFDFKSLTTIAKEATTTISFEESATDAEAENFRQLDSQYSRELRSYSDLFLPQTRGNYAIVAVR